MTNRGSTLLKLYRNLSSESDNLNLTKEICHKSEKHTHFGESKLNVFGS